ncbi:MAG: hypothetical protein ACFB51_21310 [Anaerolineae bacterium]
MATYQTDTFTEQDRDESVGRNYRQLLIWIIVLVGGTALLLIAQWYGYVIFPRDQALSNPPYEPLVEEIPLEVMPVLPDTLAQEYDDLEAAQAARLDQYTVVDEGQGIVTIPLDEAIDLLLEQGLPVRSETGN